MGVTDKVNALHGQAGVVELASARLYALGDNFMLDERVSWAPQGFRGYQAANSYLVLDGDEALLVDTGLAVVGEAIIRQLESLCRPGSDLDIYITRPEFDTMGNLSAIAERYRVRVLGRFSAFGTWSNRPAESTPARAGQFLAFGSRQLNVVEPGLRLLPTSWLYD